MAKDDHRIRNRLAGRLVDELYSDGLVGTGLDGLFDQLELVIPDIGERDGSAACQGSAGQRKPQAARKQIGLHGDNPRSSGQLRTQRERGRHKAPRAIFGVTPNGPGDRGGFEG